VGDAGAARAAGAALAAPGDTLAPRGGSSKARPWYKDIAAWTLVGSGVVALGVGLAMYSVYGRPSRLEPIALSLAAGGTGIAGTGVVLFFFPTSEGDGSGGPTASATYGISITRGF
jgi:hypothetical protein